MLLETNFEEHERCRATEGKADGTGDRMPVVFHLKYFPPEIFSPDISFHLEYFLPWILLNCWNFFRKFKDRRPVVFLTERQMQYFSFSFDLILNKDDDMRLTIQKTKRRKRRAGTTILDFKCLRFPAKRNPNGCYQLYAVWHTVYVDIVLTQCWWWKIIWEWKKGFFPCQLKRGSKVVAQSRDGRHCRVLVGRTGVIWNWNSSTRNQLRRQWFQTEDWRYLDEEADRQDKTQAGQLNAPAHAVPGSNMELSLVNMEKEKKDTFYFSSCQLVFDRLEEIPKQCTSTSMLDSFFDWENLISIALERCSWCHSGIGLISKFWWTINLCLCTEAWVISQQPPCLKNKLVGLVQDGLQ